MARYKYNEYIIIDIASHIVLYVIVELLLNIVSQCICEHKLV